ncbi:MAG: cob(I)yrinic acid a,c-diamide adenosyltransferase [Actinomycetota bacterium]|nr:cob(I)yrinic acid a,c-diamide adenosyltransferase [Actinomycetota bacterium]
MSGPIYTRRGDEGETSLADGSRVTKNSARVAAYGTLDEANSAVGLARACLEMLAEDDRELDAILDFAQHRLFNCSSNTATPTQAVGDATPVVTPDDVTVLEAAIDRFMSATSVEGFVLPFGCESAARLHVARTVVRRAERSLLDLAEEDAVDSDVLAFVNRLSDLLFAAAIFANERGGCGNIYWDPERGPGPQSQ